MTGRIVRVWRDESEPDRIHFLVVQRHGRARRSYVDKGHALYDTLLRHLP